MAETSASGKTGVLKRNKEFLIFISIPLVIIGILAVVLLLPSVLAHPRYNFIYSYCPSYGCNIDYRVNDAGMITQSNSYDTYGSSANDLYMYDVTKNAGTRISLDQAQTYTLNSSNVSPDGYLLTQGNTNGGSFLFFGSDGDYNWYLKNGLKRKLVHLAPGNLYDSNAITFVGWVAQ